MKFCHTAMHRHENLFQVPVLIGGFYGWHRAMDGDFKLYPSIKGNLEQYDILFIGMSKPELEGTTASNIRKEIGWDSKTKLIICIDYSPELWQGVFNPYALENELMQADMIFTSGPILQSYVRSIVNDRKKVHHILHPSDIESIRKFSKPKEQRTNEIVALIHRYDNNWLAPYLATKEHPWNTYAVALDQNLEPHLYAYFPFIKTGQEFLKYLDWVSRKKIVVDSYHKIHNYGRSPVDNACLGLPTVGSKWTYAQSILWPDLTSKAGDVFHQRQLIEKIMTDDNFYDECVEYANDKVEMFSYENRKKELLEKLNV